MLISNSIVSSIAVRESPFVITSRPLTTDHLGMCCATRVRTIDEWKTCLIAPCPKSAPPVDWLYWIAQSLFRKLSISQDSPDLENVVAAYKEVCPHIRGLVPIALMSAGLFLISEIYYHKKRL